MISEIAAKLFGVTTALADEAAAAGEVPATSTVAEIIGLILPMLLIVVVFYFMLIRPQKKKDKQVKDMLDNLKVSDRVCTIGGIYGTIIAIKDDTFTLSVGTDNVKLIVARWAIRNVEEMTIENDGEALV